MRKAPISGLFFCYHKEILRSLISPITLNDRKLPFTNINIIAISHGVSPLLAERKGVDQKEL